MAVVVSWGEDDDITAEYIVDGERMTEREFYRRWPDYKSDGVSVSVNWD